jgi:predicted phage terminase large subunit-like protein
MGLYAGLNGHPRAAQLEWVFPWGSRIKFAHLEHDKNVYDWQGSQIPFIGFDELTHFSEQQFWYMLSRNRSTTGIPGYMRATCNPDVDSWVRKLIDWWIDADGYPIQERSGIIRWFIRIDDQIIWGDSREELIREHGADQLPKSLTFIPSRIQDNKILMAKDPSYLANLRALNRVERLRLLGGNWNVRATAGMMFQREWFTILDTVPAGWVTGVRFWDRAATEPNEGNQDPDWTRGVKLVRYPNDTFMVVDMKSLRKSPGQVETLIKQCANHDGARIRVRSQRDPGSAGVAEAENFVRMLKGFDVATITMTKKKLSRAKPVSAQVENGNVFVLRAPWNEDFFSELEGFPDVGHDDIVDALSGAFNELSGAVGLLDAL